MNAELLVVPTPDDVTTALARYTARALRAVLASEPRATLCLTGGSTPAPAYRQLATADLDWDRVHVFWGDERAVPPDHEDSNFHLAFQTLLKPAGVPESNVHRMEGERGAEEAATAYEQTLEEFFGDGPLQFDVLHLGLGSDGHIASLFPNSPALGETDRRVVTTEAPPDMAVRDRISLTFPVLNLAHRTYLAAHGARKRDILGEIVDAFDTEGAGPPAARLQPVGDLTFIVDQAMAQGVQE